MLSMYIKNISINKLRPWIRVTPDARVIISKINDLFFVKFMYWKPTLIRKPSPYCLSKTIVSSHDRHTMWLMRWRGSKEDNYTMCCSSRMRQDYIYIFTTAKDELNILSPEWNNIYIYLQNIEFTVFYLLLVLCCRY